MKTTLTTTSTIIKILEKFNQSSFKQTLFNSKNKTTIKVISVAKVDIIEGNHILKYTFFIFPPIR
jgi:hypothetical protein